MSDAEFEARWPLACRVYHGRLQAYGRIVGYVSQVGYAHKLLVQGDDGVRREWTVGHVRIVQMSTLEQQLRLRLNLRQGEPMKAPPVEAPAAKPLNPKQLYGDKKPPLHLIHMIAQLHESAALHAGKRKYGENNYISTPVEIMTYVGAIMRHCLQYASGERVDKKELVHHLGAIKACCTILLTAEACGVLVDNRPEVLDHPKCAERGAVSYQAATANTFAEIESVCEHLNKLYPNLL